VKSSHVLLAVSTAATIATAATSCTQPTPATPVAPAPSTQPPAGTVGVLHVSDHGLSFTAGCGTGTTVIAVTPDNPATRAAATKACAQTNGAINNLPWPSGVHPIPFGGGWGG